MKKLMVLFTAVAALTGASTASSGTSSGLCVGGSGCFATLKAALAAAHDGDVIHVHHGTYSGGVTIDVGVSIVGDDAVIEGGGPVLTIGRYDAASEPTVSLKGLTITGGVTTSSPIAQSEFGEAHLFGDGGGIAILPGANGVGGIVTITNSVVTANRAYPTSTEPSGGAVCPGDVPCPFALARGGGIFNTGALTLVHTQVTDNVAGSKAGIASDADGGGIYAVGSGASTTILHSTVSGNTAEALTPDGRFAEGGGVFTHDDTALTVADSKVNDNRTVLSSTFPHDVGGGQTLDMNSNSGGIHMGDNVTVTIDRTHVDGNSVTVNDPNGEPLGFAAGVCTCTSDQASGMLVLRHSTVSHNTLDVTVASQADVFPGSGDTLEIDSPGTIDHVEVIGNRVSVHALSGDADIGGPSGVETANVTSTPVVISNTRIAGNTATAVAPDGLALILGVGLLNQGPALLENDDVTGNQGSVEGKTMFAQGGGIFNGTAWNPGGPLTLEKTTVKHNVLKGGSGATLQGGGLYTVGYPVTLTKTTVTGNSPDQCDGC